MATIVPPGVQNIIRTLVLKCKSWMQKLDFDFEMQKLDVEMQNFELQNVDFEMWILKYTMQKVDFGSPKSETVDLDFDF